MLYSSHINNENHEQPFHSCSVLFLQARAYAIFSHVNFKFGYSSRKKKKQRQRKARRNISKRLRILLSPSSEELRAINLSNAKMDAAVSENNRIHREPREAGKKMVSRLLGRFITRGGTWANLFLTDKTAFSTQATTFVHAKTKGS